MPKNFALLYRISGMHKKTLACVDYDNKVSSFMCVILPDFFLLLLRLVVCCDLKFGCLVAICCFPSMEKIVSATSSGALFVSLQVSVLSCALFPSLQKNGL